MAEQTQTFACRVCEKPVSKETGLCDYCGFKHAKNFSAKLTALIIVVLLMFSLLIYSSVKSPDVEIFVDDTLGMPINQKAFVNILGQYRKKDLEGRKNTADYIYVDTIAMRVQRAQDLKTLNLDIKITDWVGKVALYKETKDGKIRLRVNLSAFVALETWADEVEDINHSTLIDPSDPLYNIVKGLKHDDVIIFSGMLFPSAEDIFLQTSPTLDTNIQLPTFLFKFQSIRK